MFFTSDGRKLDIGVRIVSAIDAVVSLVSKVVEGDSLTVAIFIVLIILLGVGYFIYTQGRSFQIIEGRENIYRAAIKVLEKSTTQRIWVTDICKEVDAPVEDWFHHIVMKLHRNREFEYKRVVGISSREELNSAKEVLDLLKDKPNALVSYFKTPLNFSLPSFLIAGDDYFLIGFRFRETFPHFQACIVIKNKQIVAKISEWYNSYLWRNATALKNTDGIKEDEIEKLERELS